MSLFAFAYHDMSAEERSQLTQLQNALDLRDRIFLGYIEKRYEHEYLKSLRDYPNLPFSDEELLLILKELAIISFLGGHARLERMLYQGPNTSTDSVVVLKLDLLNLFDIAGALLNCSFNEDYLSSFIEITTQLSILTEVSTDEFSFIHALLRDTLAYQRAKSTIFSKDKPTRLQSIQVLGMLRDSRATPYLVAALKDDDKEIRSSAVYTLGEIRDVSAVTPLLTEFINGDKFIRNKVAFVLGEIGDEMSFNALILASNDPDLDVRNSIKSALGNIMRGWSFEQLVAKLNEGTVWPIHSGVLEILREIGTPEALAAVADWEEKNVAG
jgi:hypothetical protein